ncbi:TonB family protein [Porphyromonadaceae bacterium]
MDESKSKINGWIGTLVFHGIILVILLFCGMTRVINELEEGVLVNFGSVNESTGEFEPDRVDRPTPEPIQPATPQASSTPQSGPQEVTTQDVEESLAMKQAEKKRKEEIESQKKKEANDKRRMEVAAAEKRKKEELAEKQRKAEEQKRIDAINKRASGAFSSNSTATSQGDSDRGSGNQGSPFGNSNTGANEGIGGHGNSWSLAGRSLRGQLPRPTYGVQEEGVVVVNITVDRYGNVLSATIGRGTNIDNQQLRNAALTAAKQAKFNDISNEGHQQGTITYRFFLR